ncbi:MAG: ABC transporter permease [Spirochaetales bacterium]|nr:ABC transporter permease [Spirochaetales bacterium]
MKLLRPAEYLGRNVISKFRSIVYAAGFFTRVLKETGNFITRKRGTHISSKVLTMQVLFTGFEALTIVAIIALGLGAAIIVQGLSLLPQFGQGELIYDILIIVITRELGPILTAFIVIARSATAISTELGNMVVSHEIEAYVATGIDPISYLVVPRFLGVTISLVLLNIYFNVFGLIGSYFLTLLIKPVKFMEYFNRLLSKFRVEDFFSSILKCLVFGVIISMCATINGLRVEQSSTEIPQVAIRAVSQAFKYCIITTAIITLIYYL